MERSVKRDELSNEIDQYADIFNRISKRKSNAKKKRRDDGQKLVVSFSIAPDMAERFDTITKEQGVNKSSIIEGLIDDYLISSDEFPGFEWTPKDEIIAIAVVSHFMLLKNMNSHLNTLVDFVFFALLDHELDESIKAKGLLNLLTIVTKLRDTIYQTAAQFSAMPSFRYVLQHADHALDGRIIPDPLLRVDELLDSLVGLAERSLQKSES